MAKDGKLTATPRLRFPEFRKATGWRFLPLGQLLSRPPEYGMNAAAIPYSDSMPTYLRITDIDDDGRFARDGKVSVGADVNEDNYLADGDIVLARTGASVGKSYRYREDDGRLVYAGFLIRVKPEIKKLSPQLLASYLTTDAYWKWVGVTSARSGQPGINGTEYAGLLIPIPTSEVDEYGLAEQQKIADCLTSLDELIAAQGRKVEALKAHKRSLMQQLFPQEGETQPRLRFPKFRDAVEWEETTLDQLVDIQSGGTPSKANPAFWNGSIPWISAKDMKQLFLEDSEDHISKAAIEDGAKLVSEGTLLMLTRGMTLLKDVPICVLRREMTFNQDVKALRPKSEVDGLFLALMLLGIKDRLLKMVDVAGHGTGKLNTDELRSLELVTPQPAEQQRIADCLSSLDARIAAETEKLAALKTHKQGLMQQLFPVAEGV
jgi:type I restriction enzyme S subunit